MASLPFTTAATVTPVAGETIASLIVADRREHRAARWLLLVLWTATALFLVSRHVVWRDEVRALSLALEGDSVWAMLRAIHGEGHPALWYLLLRGGHAVTGMKEVLPAIAFLAAAASAALFTLRAPFRPLVLALVLFSGFALVDYAVVARNYGIAMLLMFAVADRHAARSSGLVMGVLLFLLCNTNAIGVLLAGAFMLFWAIELLLAHGPRWAPAVRQWLIAAVLTGLGVLACFAVLYPPYNDAASLAAGTGTALLSPFGLFSIALPLPLLSAGLGETGVGVALFAAVMIGSLAGLARAPAALIAAAVLLAVMTVFFHVVYPGMYRHQALFVVFLIAMYWLAAAGRGGAWPDAAQSRRVTLLDGARRWGGFAFVCLLALQVAIGIALFASSAKGDVFSRSRDLGRLLAQPSLRDAVVVGNPDVILEPLSYYAPNPVYLARERRWGRVVAFTKAAMRTSSLAELLDTARRLRRETGRPVVIVLQKRLVARAPAEDWDQGYIGRFVTTPEQVRAFLTATRRLASFAPAITDETYDVYLLR
jgi:hypothetical protein